MNYTYGFILALSVFLTFFTIYRPNLLFAICSTAAWFGLLAFHNANPPTGITNGSTIDQLIMLAYIGMALVMPIHTLRVTTRKGHDIWGGGERNSDDNAEQGRGLMDLSVDEYKADLHKRMHRRRR